MLPTTACPPFMGADAYPGSPMSPLAWLPDGSREDGIRSPVQGKSGRKPKGRAFVVDSEACEATFTPQQLLVAVGFSGKSGSALSRP